ncbi:alpha 1,4-glycosyltransferase family protein [Striga asiatica]|uniref:Alpha 1,4-glycosyltransferase family protein n=1 Tax=Striga asiatica TaxID=4170 RepID=A0A5A7PKM9_STRAF|nr:alpha 1,4-glycosyltransferase family protein [Striga asiatica]
MLRHLRTRRRPRYGAHLCALIAAVLLLFSALTTSSSNDDRIDELDDAVADDGGNGSSEEILAEEDEEDASANQNGAVSSNYFFDPVSDVIRRAFNRRSIEEWEDYVPFNLKLTSDLGFSQDESKPVFGSDDVLVNDKLRKKLSEVKNVEDALLLKGSVLREGWGEWFDKKGDFLRRDRMFKSNIEVLNPLHNPILQDPDGAGVTGLTRGDRVYLKGLLNEFKKTPFLTKKPLSISESETGKEVSDEKVGRTAERRTLNDDHIRKIRSKEGLAKDYYADGKRWGYYPGLDGRLSFGNFMDAFFRRGRCTMRVFMVWNSPPWMFGVRQQRGLESLLYHHMDACVVVFSETVELNFFNGFVKEGYKVAVVMADLDELLKDTPTHIFASVWLEWKKTKYYPTHYSELIRLAALYKYGGIYLDSDMLVLKSLSDLNNTIGFESEPAGSSLNGAVMAFRKHSPFIMSCLEEFYASYDDTELRWNGADLLTRVANKFLSNKDIPNMGNELILQPASVFSPIDRSSISRYFTAPETETEKLEQDRLFHKILNQSATIHFWDSLTSALIPETDSLIFKLLNRYCIRCSDVL